MTRVLLVDDQELVRSGFRIILDSEPDIEVVGEAGNGAEAIALAFELRPDVICMDVEMPVMNGIEAARQILQGTATPPAVLVLTTFGHETYLFEALAAGVSGFLLKTSRAEQLIDAVHSLAAGDALLGPDVTRAVIARVASDRNGSGTTSAPADPVPAGLHAGAREHRGEAPSLHGDASAAPSPGTTSDALFAEAGVTAREREVLLLLAEGKSNAEIASVLFLGEATVKTHVSNLLQKLGVRDRIQAVVWAHTRGAV